MATTEICWSTAHGDIAGITVHGLDAEHPDRIRLVIGHLLMVRVPPTEARLLAQALLDAAADYTAPAPRRVIPIHAAPPAALYHEPEEGMPCPN